LEEWTNDQLELEFIMEPFSSYALFAAAAVFGMIGVAGLAVFLVVFGEALFLFYKKFFEC
jgi:hypothetical protein